MVPGLERSHYKIYSLSSDSVCRFQGPQTKFLDTMSLHVCVAGQTASQKMLWQKVCSTMLHTGRACAYVHALCI